MKKNGHLGAYVGDVVGTGSCRKSATNQQRYLEATGQDIPFVLVPPRVTVRQLIPGELYDSIDVDGGSKLHHSCGIVTIKRWAKE